MSESSLRDFKGVKGGKEFSKFLENNNVMDQLTANEIDNLQRWTIDSGNISEYLREPSEDETYLKEKEFVKNIDSAFSKATPLDKSTKLYRSAGTSFLSPDPKLKDEVDALIYKFYKEELLYKAKLTKSSIYEEHKQLLKDFNAVTGNLTSEINNLLTGIRVKDKSYVATSVNTVDFRFSDFIFEITANKGFKNGLLLEGVNRDKSITANRGEYEYLLNRNADIQIKSVSLKEYDPTKPLFREDGRFIIEAEIL